MHIACDIRVFLSNETGVGTYFRQLLSHLGTIDRENTYLLFSSSWKQRFRPEKLPVFAHSVLVDKRIPVKLLNGCWHWWRFPPTEFFFKQKIDLSHSPTPMILPCQGKKIITVHDLFFMQKRDMVQRESSKHYFRFLEKNVRLADGIICVSETTRNNLLNLIDIAPKKIAVIHHGIAPLFFKNAGQRPDLTEKYRLPEKFILFTGTIEPRKNIKAVLQILLSLREQGISIPLVIAGNRGWDLKEYIDLKEKLAAQVREIGYVNEADLPYLYQQAHFLVFPSLAEGFGFPLLEALAAATPVLCSDIPIFREIGRDFPVFFRLTEPDDLRAKILQLWRNEKKTAAASGVDHAGNFKWGNTARRTLAFYEKIAGDSR